ncbi:MAG: flagellar basal body L-ring protein FlgH [Alphaproteobacteria bacterium]|nr:MAG: flagellar basal body L-ring protein FlgH [Alphaproteobacteria bacterium]
MRIGKLLGLCIALVLAGCSGRLEDIGQMPELTPIDGNREAMAMASIPIPADVAPSSSIERASLWEASRHSLLGDRRAQKAGDILTVVIKIDDQAKFSASSSRGQSGSEDMTISKLLGLESREPLSQFDLAPGIATSSSSASAGDGSTSRNEKLTLRIAATIVGMLPNGVLQIQGSQEIRVNYELRELTITGFVRPEDISRQNEIPYDKIASARISYGGRGRITEVQQPRVGQQLTDMLMPF